MCEHAQYHLHQYCILLSELNKTITSHGASLTCELGQCASIDLSAGTISPLCGWSKKIIIQSKPPIVYITMWYDMVIIVLQLKLDMKPPKIVDYNHFICRKQRNVFSVNLGFDVSQSNPKLKKVLAMNLTIINLSLNYKFIDSMILAKIKFSKQRIKHTDLLYTSVNEARRQLT